MLETLAIIALTIFICEKTVQYSGSKVGKVKNIRSWLSKKLAPEQQS